MAVQNGQKHSFLIAGTHSGCGKTTITLGLLAALRARGLKIQPFKVGPDFIDPGLHSQIAGSQSRNLDGWMLDRKYNFDLFRRLLASADVGVVEGVMGLFDGYEGGSEAGSSAQMAKWLGVPAILVVDARSMARSAAALVHGFINFDPALDLRCVIFNRIGSPAHLEYLREAVGSSFPELAILGGIPREERVQIPERHLGLVTADEMSLDGEWRKRLAELIERSLDLDLLLKRTRYSEFPDSPSPNRSRIVSASEAKPPEITLTAPQEAPASGTHSPAGAPLPGSSSSRKSHSSESSRAEPPPSLSHPTSGPRQSPGPLPFSEAGPGEVSPRARLPFSPGFHRATIGVARDAAFCFYYPDNFELLEQAGASLHFFSPLAGESFPEECSGVYLGGGYPEVFAEGISRNSAFLGQLRERAVNGMPIYAECGGLMSLGRFIDTIEGKRFPMAGILPFGTRMLARRRALGYTEVVLRRKCLLGDPGARMRGHEFHYSEIVGTPEEEPGLELAYELRARKFEQTRNEGYMAGSVLASYIHLHWGSAPGATARFVDKCEEWQDR